MAVLDADTKRREAEEKRRLVDRAKLDIKALVTKIPRDHSTWSYQKAVAFKAAVDKANQILKSERATVTAAQMAAAELARYHQ